MKRRAAGQRFLRMAGANDLAAAASILQDAGAPVHGRCLAARALGLLGDDSARVQLDGCDPRDESPLGRACYRAYGEWFRRRDAERRITAKQTARETMRHLGVDSPAGVLAMLRDRSTPSERREAAAAALGGSRWREAVATLINVMAEGQPSLSWTCMKALTDIGSRCGARRLIAIARDNYPLSSRQEAIYTLWQLREVRAESLFIRLGAALDSEEEYTRDMATEALGNTSRRLMSQRALAERLFDPSPSVRYAALCACSMMRPQPFPFPGFLRRALIAKLEDPAKLDEDRVIAVAAAQLLGR